MPGSKRNTFPNWKITEEWVGDAALDYLVRRQLVLRYPKLEVRDLESRRRALITNQSIHQYCCDTNAGHGPNKMERKIANLMLMNRAEAEKLVDDMITSSNIIKRIDGVELTEDGELKMELELARLKKAQLRQQCEMIYREQGIEGLMKSGIIPASKVEEWYGKRVRKDKLRGDYVI